MSNYFSILDESNNVDDVQVQYVINDIVETKSRPTTPQKKYNRRMSYDKQILLIQDFFGVSNICAVYLYYRRRRGTPWRKKSDPKYLEWDIGIQNGLIQLDSIVGFNWMSLQFGYEEAVFDNNNISIKYTKATRPLRLKNNSCDGDKYLLVQSSSKNEADSMDDGFVKVSSNKFDPLKELNKMGFLPKYYRC